MLLNTTARILNLYKRYKNRNDAMRKRKTGELTVSDLEDAEKFWILEAQSVIRSAVKEGKLLRLCPRYRNGIIVVGGRAEHWMQATWNKQEFILLPHNHRLSHLIAESEHAKGGHLGVSSTVAKIRSRFWIINVQNIVKSICNKCIKCRKKFKMLCGQAMKDLPVERLQPSPPFTNVGVDFFGPFTIKGEVQKRTRQKFIEFELIITELYSFMYLLNLLTQLVTSQLLLNQQFIFCTFLQITSDLKEIVYYNKRPISLLFHALSHKTIKSYCKFYCQCPLSIKI